MVWAEQAAYQRPSPRASGYKKGFRRAGGGSLSAPALSRPSVSLPRLIASGLGERRVLVTTEHVRKMQTIKKKVHFLGAVKERRLLALLPLPQTMESRGVVAEHCPRLPRSPLAVPRPGRLQEDHACPAQLQTEQIP